MPINLDDLSKRKPPLARVLDALSEGKTARDSPTSIAADVANLLEARKTGSKLSDALDELEKTGSHLNIETDLQGGQ